MRGVLSWIFGILIVAALVHVGSVWLVPRVIMWRVVDRIGSDGMNTIRFGKRPDATARGIVRPSPDLLYGTCAYDLTGGPLLIKAVVLKGTYWSVSLFDDDTNNFYVKNDKQAAKGVVDLVLTAPGQPAPAGHEAVTSPSTRGLVLFRTLIDDDKKLPAIDKARRVASCETVGKI